MRLTPVPASIVNAPMIKESPVNIECVVKEINELGSHHMFISEVLLLMPMKNILMKKQVFSGLMIQFRSVIHMGNIMKQVI